MSISEFLELLVQHQMLLVYLGLLVLVFIMGLSISDRKSVTSSLMAWQVNLNLALTNFNTLNKYDLLALQYGCVNFAIAFLSSSDNVDALEITLRKFRGKYSDEAIDELQKLLNEHFALLESIAYNKNNLYNIKYFIRKRLKRRLK